MKWNVYYVKPDKICQVEQTYVRYHWVSWFMCYQLYNFVIVAVGVLISLLVDHFWGFPSPSMM